MLDLLPLGSEAEVLDLGAGTGKLTRMLAARYRRVVAVEPLDGMRAILEQTVPAAESLAGSAEAIPLTEASVDGVFAGQAFHWFANDEGVAEIARVLRPGGVLCLVWNRPGEPSPLPESYLAYLETLQTPSLQAIQSADAWVDLIARGPFGGLHKAAIPHEQAQARDRALEFAESVSWIAHRPENERTRIMRDLDAMLPEGPFVFPIVADVGWAVRA